MKRLRITLAAVLMIFCAAVMFSACGAKEQEIQETPVKLYVTFETNGGNEIAPFEFIKGNIPSPNDFGTPEKYGFTFYAWYKDAELTMRYNSINDYELYRNDFILYAKWENSYKISFNLNGGEGAEFVYYEKDYDGYVVYGELQTPKKAGYTFRGWYFTDDFSEQVEPNHIIDADKTIYAKWAEDFTVTFNTDGGEELQPQFVAQGDKIYDSVADTFPTKDNFVFDGWYLDEVLETPLDAQTAEGDIELFAKWVNALTLSFETNGGSDKAAITVGQGQWIYENDLGDAPAKDGFIFRGWYKDIDLKEKMTSLAPQESATLYARWIPESAVILTAENFADYFDVNYTVKKVRMELPLNLYTYKHTFVYSVALKDTAYAESIYSCDSIEIQFQFEFYKEGYKSLYLSESVTLDKANNYEITDQETENYQNIAETGILTRYEFSFVRGDIHKQTV